MRGRHNQGEIFMADKTQKCKHTLCNCTVADGKSYCSQICEDAKKQSATEIACQCGHPGCRASV